MRVVPPAAAARSSTSTRAPAAAALTAAQPPAMPNPMTTTSTSSDQGHVTIGRRRRSPGGPRIARLHVAARLTAAPVSRSRRTPASRAKRTRTRRYGTPGCGRVTDRRIACRRASRRADDAAPCSAASVTAASKSLGAVGLHADVVQTRPAVGEKVTIDALAANRLDQLELRVAERSSARCWRRSRRARRGSCTCPGRSARRACESTSWHPTAPVRAVSVASRSCVTHAIWTGDLRQASPRRIAQPPGRQKGSMTLPWRAVRRQIAG